MQAGVAQRPSTTQLPLQARPYPSLLSIVIPMFNEQEVIVLLRDRLNQFCSELPGPVEIILVDDGSTDATAPMLADWAHQDPRAKVLLFARNFGHQQAITAGMDIAAGDAVVIMDADLQDPPEVVLQMLERYRQGYDVIYAQRISREGESLFKRLTAWGFYRFMRRFIHKSLPADTGDFRLMSRRSLLALRSLRETHRFIRGMVAWVGFAQIAVPFKRPPRAAGTTKYPLSKMLKFAWNAALSFSPAPMRVILLLGFLVAFFGAGYACLATAMVLAGYWTQPGWSSIIVLLCLIGGAILIAQGIIGEYVGKIFEETKGRPLYIVGASINVEPPANAPVAPLDLAANAP